MSELEQVERMVREAGRRRRWQRAWRGLWFGVLAGAGVWLLGLGLYKLLPLPELTLAFAGVTGVLCFAAGGLVGWWRADGLLGTARWLDERQQLKERLSTAIELGRDENFISVRRAERRIDSTTLENILSAWEDARET